MLWLLPPLCWTGLIMYLGGGQWSSEETSAFLGPMLRALLPGFSPEFLGAVHFLIRKTAHLSEYGVLAVLWRRATRRSWIALFLCVLTASVDEFRQLFTPGRVGSVYDVLLDGTGAAAFLALVSALRSRLGRSAWAW
jgi:VanZ family protein